MAILSYHCLLSRFSALQLLDIPLVIPQYAPCEIIFIWCLNGIFRFHPGHQAPSKSNRVNLEIDGEKDFLQKEVERNLILCIIGRTCDDIFNREGL